jgi:2-polyprenyl-6-methoxyphenol hydroxylase-like FAD-dependent oxidoreductase
MLGLLLARAGVPVVVFEKHNDFLRDFRGDTIHPSTLEILDQLGLAQEFLSLPHSEVSTVSGRTTAGQTISFTLKRLPTKYPFIAFVPQWDFLEFLTRWAARYAPFRLVRNAQVVDLAECDGTVTGVRYRDGTGEHEVSALLTVGADGRDSRTREAAGLPRVETSAPMDVLWFRVPRKVDEPEAIVARLGAGRILVMLDRREYWQVAFVIQKGKADEIRAAGIEAFQQAVVLVAPELADRIGEVQGWDQIKLLTVRSDRLLRWYRPGYLAIGDAAHAMSPVGGLGINVAIHDAVVAANLLWRPLSGGSLSEASLSAVQKKRERAVRVMQALQSFAQNRVLGPVLASSKAPSIPWAARMLLRAPIVRDIPPRIIGLGIGRPRVESPERV